MESDAFIEEQSVIAVLDKINTCSGDRAVEVGVDPCRRAGRILELVSQCRSARVLPEEGFPWQPRAKATVWLR